MIFLSKNRQKFEARHYSLLNNVDAYILIIEKNGTILFYNSKLKVLFEKIKAWLPIDTLEEFYSYNYFDLYLDAQRQREICASATTFPLNSTMDIGNEIITAHINPLFSNGKNSRLVVTWKCVTREKNQERWEHVVEDQIENVSSELTLASNELLQASAAMQTTAKNNSTHAEDATSFLKEVTGSVIRVAEDVKYSSANIHTIAENVAESREMNEKALALSQDTRQHIIKLSELAGNISSMVQTIQEITAQTHILSLNANVEAARAGSSGSGFAVIASEVGTLAKQTGAMSRKITGSVEQIQKTIPLSLHAIKTVEEMVGTMNDTAISISDLMEHEQILMDTIKQQMDTAGENSEKITQRMEEIVEYSGNSLLQIETSQSIGKEIDSIAGLFNLIISRFKDERIVTPNDIYHLLTVIQQLIFASVEKKFSVQLLSTLQDIPVQSFKGKKPTDVLRISIESYQIILSLNNLSPDEVLFPKGTVTPTQTYNFLLKLLDTLESILIKEGCVNVRQLKVSPPVTGKNPDHAYAVANRMHMILRKIESASRNDRL